MSHYPARDFGGVALWLPPGVAPDGPAIEAVFAETLKKWHSRPWASVAHNHIAANVLAHLRTALRGTPVLALRKRSPAGDTERPLPRTWT